MQRIKEMRVEKRYTHEPVSPLILSGGTLLWWLTILFLFANYSRPREDKGDREGISHTHQVIRLDLFLESG